MPRITLVSILMLLLVGCVSTSLTSYTDPAFAGASFSRVAVWADTTDLEWRQDLEAGMHERIVTTTGASAIRAIDVAPPTRDYEPSEVFQLLRGTDVEAVIIVSFTDTGVTQSVSGNQYGVSTYESPWAQADVTLFDIETGSKVWTGTAKTQGDEFTDWAAVRRSAGNKVVSDLLDNGLLRAPAQ